MYFAKTDLVQYFNKQQTTSRHCLFEFPHVTKIQHQKYCTRVYLQKTATQQKQWLSVMKILSGCCVGWQRTHRH